MTNWKIEFDKLFHYADTGRRCLIDPINPHKTTLKEFIDSLLSSQKQELTKRVRGEITGMKKIRISLASTKKTDARYERAREYEIFKDGYNQALNDLIVYLDKPTTL